MNAPRISVALAAFDGGAHLAPQLDGVLAQLAEGDELVVSDDGSTDGTLARLAACAARDPRVRLLRNDGARPRGVAANFAAAFAAAQGEVVLPCDQDDLWLPGRIAHFRARFAADPRLLVLQTDARLVDGAGEPLHPSFFALRGSRPGLFRNLWRNAYQGCTMGFRRTLLDAAAPIPARIPMHDQWLGLVAELAGGARRGAVAFDGAVLTAHRRHGANATSLAPAPFGRRLSWRLRLAAALLGRLPRIRAFRRRTWKGLALAAALLLLAAPLAGCARSDAVTVSAGLGAATVHVDVDADGFWYNLRENAAAS